VSYAVFERFARGDSSRSRAAGSTGLGLAIVSAVVTAHRGTVSVDSSPGHTAFTVRLPVAATGGLHPPRSARHGPSRVGVNDATSGYATVGQRLSSTP
jgi:two-component system, OmpR family, sensor kinase